MKFTILLWSVASLLAVPALAAPQVEQAGSAISVEEALGKAEPEPAGTKVTTTNENTEDAEDDYTTFNGMKVPPLKEIEGDQFDETVKEGYWYV